MDQQNITASDVIISVKDLKKYYNEGAVKALDGITTDIRRGEVTVIIGPSGSGKSTFLRSLNLWELPTSGTILFDGTDITDPRIRSPALVKSIIPTYPATEVSFSREINSLHNAGRQFLNICGTTM